MVTIARRGKQAKKENETWINDRILAFDEALRQSFNQGKKSFLESIIYSMARSTAAAYGVLYEMDHATDKLFAVAGYSTKIDNLKSIALGDQLVGQCALSQKEIFIHGISDKSTRVLIGNERISIQDLLLIPIIFNGVVYGVIQLKFIEKTAPKVMQFALRAASNSAVLIESISKSDEIRLQQKKLVQQEQVLIKNLKNLKNAKQQLEDQKERVEITLEELSKQTQRIEESITYAQTIQQSILPSEQTLKRLFHDTFVIFQPVDVVSGDFYWFGQSGGYEFLAVVDCTGHGVPGAFMSMIGNTLLNQIILEKKEYEPAQILSSIHQGVSLNLFSDAKESRKDGMDMVICRFKKSDSGSYDLAVAGAKSYFFCIDQEELTFFRGNSQSLGGANIHRQLEFDQKTFTARPRSKVILLSDGWLDNPNHKRRGYGAKRFKRLLESNQRLSLRMLQTKIIDDMKTHQGEQKQRDDITLLGVEL